MTLCLHIYELLFSCPFQALAEEMDGHNERLGWLNKHAPQILSSPGLSPQSRDQQVGRLRAINLSWSKVLFFVVSWPPCPPPPPTSSHIRSLIHTVLCRSPVSCWTESGRWRPTCKATSSLGTN